MATTEFDEIVIDQDTSRHPLLSICTHPGCTVLTMGGTCVEHDVPLDVEFPRGRPYVPAREKRLSLTAIE